MLIAMKKSFDDVILVEDKLPKASKNQVLIKVESCGEYKYFGHEMSGYVTEIGELVTNVKVGERVVVQSTGFCGHCNMCRDGKVDLCENTPMNDGFGFSEYALAACENCIVLPDEISFKHAGIIEPLGVAIDVVKTADIKLGDHVLVYGTGSIGLMALQLAKKSGATKIYAVLRSHSKKKAELALKFGADDVIYSDKMDLKEYNFPKGGVDKVLVTAQNSVIPEALDLLNYGGTAVFIGFGGEPNITINANTFHIRKLQLKSSFAKPGIYFPLAIETILSNVINCDDIITHTMPLAKIKELMQIAGGNREEVVKAVMLNSNK